MRRMILAAATSSLVLALVPAGAMARQHSHHKRHHARHQVRHHKRVHRVIHRRFGDVNNPATTPTTGTPSSDAVGTVDSFTNGTLTIKLNNGSTVSGMVTNDTEIECEAAQSTVMTDTHRDGGGDNGGSGSGDNGGQNSGDDHGDQGDQGDDNDQDDQAQQACTTANLTQGASVRGAELKISSAGAVWDKVDLIS